MPSEMTIKGLDELEKQIVAIAKADYVDALEIGVREVLLPEMKSLTPVDKGDLLASEEVQRTGDSVSLYAGTDHALPVEFGTIHMPAQSYMRAAIDNKMNEALEVTGREVEKIMEKAI